MEMLPKPFSLQTSTWAAKLSWVGSGIAGSTLVIVNTFPKPGDLAETATKTEEA